VNPPPIAQSLIAGRFIGQSAALPLRCAINGQTIAHTHAEALDFSEALAHARNHGTPALMALDFHMFELVQDHNGWRVETEPYGASEVVVRFPAMRRYIRLTREQARYLVNALARLQGKLRYFSPNAA